MLHVTPLVRIQVVSRSKKKTARPRSNKLPVGERAAGCRKCPRLVAHREKVATEKKRAYRDWDYWGAPVPAWGAIDARVWLLGLAPGAHGSNRTGRVFTGDGSGDFLFPALHRAGFASQPIATARDDGMTIDDLFVTQVCRCAPPANKPTPAERANCRPWLLEEVEAAWPHVRVVIAMGQIAHDAWLEVCKTRLPKGAPPIVKARHPFGHAAEHPAADLGLPDGPTLIDCYHVSRQNTQTGRLTAEMLDDVLARVRELAELPAGS